MTRASFDDAVRTAHCWWAGPDEVVDKIVRHREALGGMVRLSFMMNVASLPQVKMITPLTRSVYASRLRSMG
jgi:hypothetical protein